MADPNPRLQDKSFLWAFVLFVLLFFAPFWGESLGLGRRSTAALLAVAGFIPFLLQAITGFALDGLWVARFSRRSHPTRFWVMLLLSLAVAGWFSFAAYNMYAAASRGAPGNTAPAPPAD